MKIAICISGHLRHFTAGYQQFFKNLIKKNQNISFDFFISTWKSKDWRTNEMFFNIDNSIDDINKIYNPIMLEIENEICFDTTEHMKYVTDPSWVKKGPGGVRSKGEHIHAMFYKIKKANDLKIEYENLKNFKYDLVIRTRTDFTFDATIDILSIAPYCHNTIFVPHCDNNAKKDGILIRDVFAMSSSENMNYYAALYSNIDNLVKINKIFRPEPLLYFHLLNKNKLKINEMLENWHIIYDNSL